MTDRVQVPTRARGDVQEPHRSSQVRGGNHPVADDTHGLEVQLSQRPVPRRHFREVIAQSPRAVALPAVVRPKGDLDGQSGRMCRGHKLWGERRTRREGRFRSLDAVSVDTLALFQVSVD